MRRWYQNIEIKGIDATFEDPGRKESKFWNEGKWDSFVKPLLPKERGTFLEIGCNAGLFLKMATDAGFGRVIGVESNSQRIRQAELYRKSNGCSYKLVHQVVGRDFDIDQLPLADVTLISNTHYYFPVSVFANLVDRLRSRTLYCIVVAAKARRRSGNAFHHLSSPGVRGYFRGWQEIGVVGDWRRTKALEDLREEGDPSPREQMYGVLFKGDLEAVSVKGLYGHYSRGSIANKEYKHFALFPALEEFFRKALSGKEFKIEETLYYEYWKKRWPKYSLRHIRKKIAYKKSLAEDIQENGMNEPIYLDRRDKILDGVHRLAIARLLGYKHIIVRRL